jgi:hypothetical protein
MAETAVARAEDAHTASAVDMAHGVLNSIVRRELERAHDAAWVGHYRARLLEVLHGETQWKSEVSSAAARPRRGAPVYGFE